jgi:L-threonylcarbamoyladenylate synthase
VTAEVRGAEPGPLPDAVAHVRAGGLLAYPTETVWGLGADCRSERALARLRAFKGRDAAQPVALLVTGIDAALGLGVQVTPPAQRLADAFWPGPLTLVLPGDAGLAPGVARADGAVGLRCSPHPLTRALAEALERAGVGPLSATSLNRSGEAPATCVAEARKLCAAAVEPVLVLEAPDTPGGPPSSVVDLTGPDPVVLRQGSIDESALLAVIGRRR